VVSRCSGPVGGLFAIWVCVMDVAALASALAGAQLGQIELAVAAKLLRMDANQAASVAKLVDSATQNANQFASVAAGIGGNLDITA
jgi:hypothetical protein